MGKFQKIVRTPDLESRQHQHWHGAPAETNRVFHAFFAFPQYAFRVMKTHGKKGKILAEF